MLARPGTGYQASAPTALPPQSTPTLETITYQHIQETSAKRISTLDYLKKAHDGRTLNALLVEFESFQQVHPPDGSVSLSRGRIPQMFKRATASPRECNPVVAEMFMKADSRVRKIIVQGVVK
ncbi:hypothetical protein BUE80_DR013016, partial [Diplocarpon rosae]